MARVAHRPLCNAVFAGDTAKLRSLVRNDPAATKHWKPIMDAAFVGNAECIRILVEGGADVNVVASTGARHTPLTRLCQFHKTIPKTDGHSDALDALLELGADSSVAAGPLALQPLCYAAMGPLHPLLERIQKHIKTVDVWTAAGLCDLSHLRHLATRNEVNVEDHRKRTPLHYVALSGMHHIDQENTIACAKLLLEEGIAVDHAEPIQEGDEIFEATALWYAVSWQGNRSLVEYLLKQGAATRPAVFSALWGGDEAMCELLDSYGTDWDLRHEGRTPLIELFHWNRPKMTAWLLSRDVNVNAQDGNGKTALDYALKRKSKQAVIDLLLEHGAISGEKL